MTKAQLIAALSALPDDAEILLCRHGVPITGIADVEVLIGHDENLISDVSADGVVTYSDPYGVIWAE